MTSPAYPDVLDPDLVGAYEKWTHSGGGFVWDAVLEYRVWVHPVPGEGKVPRGGDRCRAFATYAQALAYSKKQAGAEEPLALVLQREWVNEPEPHRYVHVKKPRVTEWDVAWLVRPRRTEQTIPDLLAAAAARSRFQIVREEASEGA